jgi:hypothetical protein
VRPGFFATAFVGANLVQSAFASDARCRWLLKRAGLGRAHRSARHWKTRPHGRDPSEPGEQIPARG